MIEAAYTSRIESYLAEKLKNVSDNIYPGTLPATLSGADTYVVIDVGSIYNDGGDFYGSVNIYMYAKKQASGKKNVSALHKMEKAFAEFMEDCDSDDYTFSEMYSDAGYDNTSGMHYSMRALNIIC
jgi:flagellar biosynthesis regulator FlaF